MDPVRILEQHLGVQPELLKTVVDHSRKVASMALLLAEKHPELRLDLKFVEEAAMLHDIGVVFTHAPTIHCHGKQPYICHGVLGRELLEKEGYPLHALVCERHTGTGLYLSEILEKNLPLPRRDLIPVSNEEKLICFADKFFSKSAPDRTPDVAEVRAGLARYGEAGLHRFDDWCRMFL